MSGNFRVDVYIIMSTRLAAPMLSALSVVFSKRFSYLSGFSDKHSGSIITGNVYLVAVYLVVKLLYIANVLAQLFLLDYALGISFHSYGVDVLARRHQRHEAGTVSDGRPLRDGGSSPEQTAQLRLPVRPQHQRLQREDLPLRLVLAGFRRLHDPVVRRLLGPAGALPARAEVVRAAAPGSVGGGARGHARLGQFVDDHLGLDGAFVLMLIRCNSDAATASEITEKMWNEFARQGDSFGCETVKGQCS